MTPEDRERFTRIREPEALIEKVAEAIRVIPSRPAMDDPNLDYWGRYWREVARAALATIEAEQQAVGWCVCGHWDGRHDPTDSTCDSCGCPQFHPTPLDARVVVGDAEQQAEVAALARATHALVEMIYEDLDWDSDDAPPTMHAVEAAMVPFLSLLDLSEPFERTLGSTRNESPATEGGSR